MTGRPQKTNLMSFWPWRTRTAPSAIGTASAPTWAAVSTGPETRTTRRGVARTVYRVDAAVAERLAKECIYVEQGNQANVAPETPSV